MAHLVSCGRLSAPEHEATSCSNFFSNRKILISLTANLHTLTKASIFLRNFQTYVVISRVQNNSQLKISLHKEESPYKANRRGLTGVDWGILKTLGDLLLTQQHISLIIKQSYRHHDTALGIFQMHGHTVRL